MKEEPLTEEVTTLPVSFAQQRLLFLDQLMPNSCLYNIPWVLHFTGKLDKNALEESINQIVKRHETLRTTFSVTGEQPLQVIRPSLLLELPTVDLSELPEVTREGETRRLIEQEGQRPFDLIRGPLLRCSLLCLSGKEHVLLITMHHVISDGWSAGVFLREFKSFYETFSAGKPAPLSELPIQYGDFAVWQREWLQGETLEKQLSFWSNNLAGVPPEIALPTDRPRPTVQSFEGSTKRFGVPKSLAESIKDLSRGEGGTLFMTLLAAFKILLFRYSSQEDFLVGTPVAGRTRTEIEGLIGFFVNTLALRTDFSDDPTFKELLRRVHKTTVEAYANQELPFEKLVEHLRPERELSRNPLVQVMFAFESFARTELKLPNLDASISETDNGTSKFDFTMFIEDMGEELQGKLEYSTELFDEATIERMAGHYLTLLEGIVANPDRHISELPLLTEAERHKVLVEWNDTAADCPKDRCVHELFEDQAERTPGAVAVVSGEESLTYGELNERANRLAHRLRKLGVDPEVPVGLCVERSLEMVVGLLGVLKAGGAYVPLDPSYPEERLAFMLRDTAPPVVLTQRRLLERLPEGHGAEVVPLDAEWHETGQGGAQNPAGGAAPGNLAYVLYTSGSTGTPKGVAIQHRSAVALLSWAGEAFSSAELAVMLASTSINFDLSVFELFLPLVHGGKVVLVEDLLHLTTSPAAHEVTIINTVPSAVSQLLRVDNLPPSVRTVNVAGEPLERTLVQRIYEQDAVRRVLNLYGPSEDTTYSTCASVERDSEESPHIGHPISNTRVYVLDRRMRPVPVGVPGELCAGGAGVARGYLGRPTLTAERFVPDPFSDEPGARLYRTGDLAKYRPDGNIEFLGRVDHQVKIRGFRVELGEVEHVLGGHPSVQECVVAVKEDRTDKHLVAYVVPDESKGRTTKELRSYLEEKLPGYMVPSAFVPLKAMPLTPNGKVDRRVLSDVEVERRDEPVGLTAPCTPVEEALAEIWTEVIGLELVSVHDNFFEVGGHSLSALRLVALAHKQGFDLSIRDVFEHQTLREMAACARPTEEETRRTYQVDKPKATPYPLLPMQDDFLGYWWTGDKNWLYLPVALEVVAPNHGADTLADIVASVLGRHESLSAVFDQLPDGSWKQYFDGRSRISCDVTSFPVDMDSKLGNRAIAHNFEEMRKTIDISTGRLVAARLVASAQPGTYYLLLLFHHLGVDALSVANLVGSIASSIVPRSVRHTVESAPMSLVIEGMQRFADGPLIREELGYWRRLPLEAGAFFPTDYPEVPRQERTWAVTSVHLSPAHTRRLVHLAQRNGLQVGDIVTSATLVGALEEFDLDVVAADHWIHGRDLALPGISLAEAIGWLPVHVPILIDRQHASRPDAVLMTVREQLQSRHGRGHGFALLKYLCSDESVRYEFNQKPQLPIKQNYMGSRHPASGWPGMSPISVDDFLFHDPSQSPSNLFSIESGIYNNELEISIGYARELFDRSTAESYSDSIRRFLVGLTRSV